MRNFYLFVLIFGIIFGSLIETSGQVSGEQQKAQQIATLFDKSKDKSKEKRGSVIQLSFETKSETVVKQNVSEYLGSYKSDTGNVIYLKIQANGNIDIGGYDHSGNRQLHYFKIKNAKIKDALFTGTKVYDDGATENFEAAFINKTLSGNLTGKLVTIFGLGVKYNAPKTDPKTGLVLNKLFFGKQ